MTLDNDYTCNHLLLKNKYFLSIFFLIFFFYEIFINFVMKKKFKKILSFFYKIFYIK